MRVGEIVDGMMYLGCEKVFNDRRVKGGEWHTEPIWDPVHICYNCGFADCYRNWEIKHWRCPQCYRRN